MSGEDADHFFGDRHVVDVAVLVNGGFGNGEIIRINLAGRIVGHPPSLPRLDCPAFEFYAM